MIAHCFFEQSGTFKNEFKRLGIEAYDYDILNDFGETNFRIDLFSEIENAYDDKPSVFDKIKTDDIILAFFPCTRFEALIQMGFVGNASSQKNWTDLQKLEYDLKLHAELHKNYTVITKMAIVAIKKKMKMIIENPEWGEHYLKRYWALRPAIIDRDRSLSGDFYKKPTQYWLFELRTKGKFRIRAAGG